MAKKSKITPSEETFENAVDNEPVFETEIDFWNEVMTEYGEIESPVHLKLLLKKLETEVAREKAKIKKKEKLMAQRNHAAKKKEAKRKKAEKRAFSALPPAKKAELKHKKLEEKMLAKQAEKQAKIDEKEAQAAAKAEKQAKKVVDAEFRMQERLFMLSLTPAEKSKYNFLRNAKKRITALQDKLAEAKAKQSEVLKSNALPVKGFLITLAICVAVTAIITFCVTNIIFDTRYYDEKVGALKVGVEEFNTKLDGEMVYNAEDLEAGLSVYQQILGKMPVMEEQLLKLNNTYFWVLNKQTNDSLGLDAVAAKAATLQTTIDQLKTIVDENTAFSDKVDEAYQSDGSLDDIKAKLSDLSLDIDQLIYSFDTLELPNGLPEHKAAYREKLVSSQSYVQLVMAYFDELIAIRGQMDSAEAVINNAQKMNVHSSDTIDESVSDYMKKLKDVTDIHKNIRALNNNVTYAQIIGKKHFAEVASGIISEGAIAFYLDINELDDIISESKSVERNCLDLPYPEVAEETHEEVLLDISQGYTDEALKTNNELIARVAAISVPKELAASMRKFTRGLEKRTEFLKLQQEYMTLSVKKSAIFGDYNAAKATYEKAKFESETERRENGRSTDKYKELYVQMQEAEKLMDKLEGSAKKDADVVQEEMKVVQKKAKKQKDDYEDDLD